MHVELLNPHKSFHANQQEQATRWGKPLKLIQQKLVEYIYARKAELKFSIFHVFYTRFELANLCKIRETWTAFLGCNYEHLNHFCTLYIRTTSETEKNVIHACTVLNIIVSHGCCKLCEAEMKIKIVQGNLVYAALIKFLSLLRQKWSVT